MIYFLNTNRPDYIDYELMDNILSFSSAYLELPEDLSLDISFSELNADGYAGYNSEEEIYYIEVNKNIDNAYDSIATIFHELVHIKQILDDKLDMNEYRNVDFSSYNMIENEIKTNEIERDMMMLWKESKR